MNRKTMLHRVRPATLRSMACLVSLLVLLPLSACEPNQRQTDHQRSDADRATRQEAVRQQLERQYMLGPEAAAKIHYQVKWQFPIAQRHVKQIIPTNDSVFILTHNNDLIRVKAKDGLRVWTVNVAKSLQEVHSVIPMEDTGLILVLLDNAIITLDILTGLAETSRVAKAKQDLEWIANSPGAIGGDYLLYGARSGQLVWQAWNIGFSWRAYQVDHTLQRKPVVQDGIVIAVGPSGVIMAFSIQTASQLWRTQLLDNIVTNPATSSQAIYIAGLDQHLRAYDLTTGKKLWRVLTTSPLVDSPVLIQNTIYQQIPGEGLAAFDALPVNDLDGERLWISDTTHGSVITQHRGSLLTWDPDTRALVSLTKQHGATSSVLHLPDVANVVSSRLMDGTLYVLGDNGRMTCLTPVN